MILALNTSTTPFSVAVVKEDGALVAETLLTAPSKGFGLFMPALHQVLSSAGVSLKRLSSLVVARGPGSFTGLRVGLAAAKGICRGLAIPAAAVSSLEALALQCSSGSLPTCALIDSRRGEVFAALFRVFPGQTPRIVKEETCLSLKALSDFVDSGALFIGNDYARQAPAVRDALGDRAILAPPSLWHLRASAVAAIGLLKAEREGFADLRNLAPSYMRPPDIRK